jgi:WD40 repeat protein
MTDDTRGLEDRGPDPRPHPSDPVRGSSTRVKVLTRGWSAALAALVIGVVYCHTESPRYPAARRFSLGESAGHARAINFGPGGEVRAAFGPEGEVRAATMLDGANRVWRIGPGSERAVPSEPALPGFSAAFSPDGVMLAVGGDSAVTLTEAAPGRPRLTLRTGDGLTCALAFSRDGGALAVAGERSVTVWDTASGVGRATARLGLCEAVSLAFGPGGGFLVTGGKDGCVRVWDLGAGRPRLALRAHEFTVTTVAVSDDGRTLASASACNRVARLWDVATGRGLVALRGHTALVQAVAFAPGGRTVATGGSDETVRLWDVPSGRERACLRCPGVRPIALAFSADGRSLAAGGFEPEVRVWNVSGIPGP